MAKSPKKPAAKPKTKPDLNQLAARIVAEATGEAPKTPDPDAGKDPAPVALGREGGLKGGKARSKSMSKKRTAAGYRTTQIVSAWASENGVTLAQVRTDEKSNEITAIPELLRLLDISGALVSIDAAGCQKNIATQIVDGGGDYLLAVKENQPRLLEDIKALVRESLETDFAGLSRHQTDEHSHGREELRFCVVLTNLEAVRDRDLWTGLKSVVCVVSRRQVNGKDGREVRYYISSRRGSGKMFLGATRRHWGIENRRSDDRRSDNLCDVGRVGYHFS